MENNHDKLDLLFEASWEVCNKIGGIYTVLSTKAKTLQSSYKSNLIFVGPDVWSAETPSPYFVENPKKLKDWTKNTGLPEGVTVRVGHWDIPGRPLTVLVKFDAMYARKDEIYGKMWELYGVDSLHAYGDYDEACAFAVASAMVIESLTRFLGKTDGRVIAHFDEWTTGMGLLYLKWKMPSIATVFTTHATSIGRSICGNNKPLYDYLKGYNGDQMAGELNMQSKHSLEKAAAHQSDCFTTVSDITAIECGQLLDKAPDVVTPNGFERNFVPVGQEFDDKRAEARALLLNVARALTGRDIPDSSFIIGTSGRCEFRNKGIDLFLDSMGKLSAAKNRRHTLAFVMVPAWVNGPRRDLAAAMDRNSRTRLDTPYMTHWINNPGQDPIESYLSRYDQPDNVTIIYVPCYLDGNDGIFNRSYYDLLIGMDATVFPSYYEPWGYTPLESVAFGVPTVTTSLSGFGQWILSSFENDFEDCGVNVIARGDYNFDAVSLNVAHSLSAIASGGPKATEKIAKAAMRTARAAAWSKFITRYKDAFDIALQNKQKRS